MTTIYTQGAVDELTARHTAKGWDIISREGSLLDNYLLFWEGLKYTVILERPLNEWSSWYTIKMFKKLPKKYAEFFEF